MVDIKSKAEIEKMRKAGRITAQILKEMAEKVKPGVTPLELDQYAENRCAELGVTPAFKGYRGFPKTVCISVNTQVVHTIPGPTPFVAGDLVKLDFGVISEGYHGDSATTVIVEHSTLYEGILVAATKQALDEAIAAIKLGGHIGDISAAVQKVADECGLHVVKTLCGHGIGRKLHEDPPVPNYGKAGTGYEIKEGLVIAIEPIFAIGGGEINLLADGWTTTTKSGGKSAHFEHTIAITENGPEVLT